MKAISLFSGVGGFDLGLERAGIETVLQAEIDPWCNKVLAPLGAHHGRQDLDHDTYVPDVAYAIAAREAKGVSLLESQTNYIANHGVRRLTPLECERLQGWPDDWTRWAADGSEIPDSHRYRVIGNGVASPVAEWIGHRMVAVGGGA